MKADLAAAATGYGRGVLAGVAIAGGLVIALVTYIHEADVKRLDSFESIMKEQNTNIIGLIVEQAKMMERVTRLDEWNRREIEDIKRRLP